MGNPKNQTVVLKLVDVLKADVKKTDGDKALEAVEKVVRNANRAMRSEVDALSDAVEAAQERLDNATKNPNSTATQLIELGRAVKVATANLEEATVIFESRF